MNKNNNKQVNIFPFSATFALFIKRANESSLRALAKRFNSGFQLKIGLDCFASFAKISRFLTVTIFASVSLAVPAWSAAPPAKSSQVVAKPTPTGPIYYGPGLCHYAQYECIKVKSGENWEKLFPNEAQRDLVQRVNRTYNNLWPGKVIAVPRNLATVSLIDLAPFPHTIHDDEKQVIVDQDKLAWGAYDAQGKLVNWGPVASGRDMCPDSPNACLTLTGIYRVFSKEDEHCKSDIFPIGKGGAKMPYCMYFHKGFALHGSSDMPGFRASHGCVRMFERDAKWLNHEFVDATNEKTNQPGTKIVVRPVTGSASGREPS